MTIVVRIKGPRLARVGGAVIDGAVVSVQLVVDELHARNNTLRYRHFILTLHQRIVPLTPFTLERFLSAMLEFVLELLSIACNVDVSG